MAYEEVYKAIKWSLAIFRSTSCYPIEGYRSTQLILLNDYKKPCAYCRAFFKYSRIRSVKGLPRKANNVYERKNERSFITLEVHSLQ